MEHKNICLTCQKRDYDKQDRDYFCRIDFEIIRPGGCQKCDCYIKKETE